MNTPAQAHATDCQCGHQACARSDWADGGYRRLYYWHCGHCGSRWGWRLIVNMVEVASGDNAHELYGEVRG